MKNRLKSTLVATALSASLLVPATVAVPAFAAPAVGLEVASSATSAEDQLKQVDEVIAQLETAQAATRSDSSKTDYGKEIRDTLAVAWELHDTIAAAATGRVPNFDIATILPRVQLLTEITDTIRIASTELTTKTNDAHAQIGFAITRAVIRVGNPSATVDQLEASLNELTSVVEKARSYPDLGPNDTATIYVKANLDKAIWQTRINRDKNILGKVPFAVYNQLNAKITHAVGVWMNPAATVQEVTDEIAALQAAYDEAASQLP